MRTRQRGAALPLGIALLLCGTIGGFVLYNTGQSATDKARVVNAADAASYSGLVWQARALNFQAYTNRAMVANQVSMAQAVSLSSWATYGAVTSANIDLVLGKIPYIGPIFTAAAQVMDGVNRVVQPVSEAMLGLVNAVNVGVGVAQQAMYVSSFAATPEIIRAVVESSDPRFTADTAFSVVGVIGNLSDWKRFTDRVDTIDTAAMTKRAEIITSQRDEFTAERNWSILDRDFHLLVASFNVDRQGETRLIQREKPNGELAFEWKAKDTVSLDLGHWNWRKGWRHKDVPIGWAETYANSEKSARTIEEGACTSRRDFARANRWFGGHDCTLWLEDNHNAERLADAGVKFRGADSRQALTTYGGLNPFRDLAPETIENDFPTMRLKVEVALDADEVRSSEAIGSAGRLRTGYRAPGKVLSSVSVAEVFFKPPMADRPGGRIEFANAYSPWWDVRLAPVSEGDRMTAFAMRDHRDTAIGSTRAPGAGGVGRGLAAWDGTALDSPHGESIGDAIRAFGELAQATGAADEIQDALVDAAQNAAENLLSGLIERHTGIGSREDLAGWVEDQAGVDIDEAERVYQGAKGEIDAVEAEVERVRGLLETDIRDLVLDRIRGAFGSEAHLLDALGDPEALEETKEEARDLLDDLEGKLVRELGREIVRRVDAVTDVFELPVEMARQHVRMMIKSLREDLAETPDWVPFGEDPIREAGTGPDPVPGDGEGGEGGSGAGAAATEENA